jgi:hypothetical protein
MSLKDLHRSRYDRGRVLVAAAAMLALSAAPALAQRAKTGTAAGSAGGAAASQGSAEGAGALEQITVTGSRLKLMGTAVTASQGVVSTTELNLLPAYRPAQLVETVPGMVATVHSGEGKASQYMLRGYNLDHGDDFAFYVAGVPVNEPTHAHGQGYSDLNFLIPEIVRGISYTKGTYYAAEGNFASVGSAHIAYADTTPSQILVSSGARGSKGFDRVLLKGSRGLNEGSLLGALDLQHYDGPWVNPDDQRKVSSVLRYSHVDQQNGDSYSITGMFYHDRWNATTDQPQRAIAQGLIGRFGSLDPSDGGYAQRSSVSAQYHAMLGMGQLDATGYLINNRLTLWNNFTHYLFDPVHGDQEAQQENRVTLGGDVRYGWSTAKNDFVAGFHTRSDSNDLFRLPTQKRVLLTPAQLAAVNYPASQIERDRVRLRSVAAYFEATTHWNDWFRTVLGFRENYMSGSDSGTNAGTASASLAQPKVNLIFRPARKTELYLSWGRGFHSDDLRGVTQAQRAGTGGAPLIAHQTGEEIGLRQHFASNLTGTLAVYSLKAQSETTYDPDVGQDTAGPGSRRRGYSMNVTYQPLSWLEFYGTYSANHSRYTSPYDDGTGHVGLYLPNAPFTAGSFDVYVKQMGHWNAGLEYRYLGKFPLSSDNVVQGRGYHEWNGDVSYTLSGWKIGLFLDNILNEKADAAEFWYADRLPGEPAGGVSDLHVHPLEPFGWRISLSKYL